MASPTFGGIACGGFALRGFVSRSHSTSAIRIETLGKIMDLKAECERLVRLGSKGPSETARTALLDALHSKWEGVQVTAARALADWGDQASLTAIRDVLVHLASKPDHWSPAGAIAHAMAPHMQESDIPWILNLYFLQSKPRNRFSITIIFSHLPVIQTISAIEKMARSQPIDPRDKREVVRSLEWYANARSNASNE